MIWNVRMDGRLGELNLEIAFEAPTSNVLIVGPNGAGKSTLSRFVTGARLPLSGHVRVNERLLMDASQNVCVPPHLRAIGYSPQGGGLFAHLDVTQNLNFGRKESNPRTRELLERLNIAALAHARPSQLSGGEKQRVALARALARDAQLLVLDEPLAALDPTTRRRVREFLVGELEARKTPALIVTHDARDVRALGGTVVVIEGGRVVQCGSCDDIMADPKSDFVVEFFDLH